VLLSPNLGQGRLTKRNIKLAPSSSTPIPLHFEQLALTFTNPHRLCWRGGITGTCHLDILIIKAVEKGEVIFFAAPDK
jgi:hypothetical protein